MRVQKYSNSISSVEMCSPRASRTIKKKNVPKLSTDIDLLRKKIAERFYKAVLYYWRDIIANNNVR